MFIYLSKTSGEMLWRGVWIAAMVCCCMSAAAGDSRPMAFKHLSVRDGLSQNTVMDILQDSQGYIWLATENGLDRYDGYGFKSYQRGLASAGELTSDYIWALAEDADANIWLATEGGGLVRWLRRSDTFQHFRHNPLQQHVLSSDRVRTLLVTAQGIWVGTEDAGLNLLDPVTGEFTHFDYDPDDPYSLPSNQVYALLQDTQGRLWVGTDDGLAWLQPNTNRFTRLQHKPENPFSLSNNRVRTLFQDRHGGIWVGTFGGGLNLLDRRTSQFKRFVADGTPGSLSHDHVRDISEDNQGRLWVGTAKGLNVLPPYSDEFAQYISGPSYESLQDDYIMSLYQDRGGVLWIGTRTGGVSTWNSQSWYFGHNKPDWLNQQSVTAFSSHDRFLWIASFNEGLTQIDRVTGDIEHIRTTSKRSAIPDNRVMSLLADREGGLWVGTMANGVAYRARANGPFEVFRHDPEDVESLGADGAMSLFEDTKGDIWIGTFGSGVTRYSPANGDFKRYTPPPGLGVCGSQGRAFAEDAHGHIWIGTESGLCRLDPVTNELRTFRHDESDSSSIASNSIYALHIDAAERLWVGTGNGGLSQMLRNPATDEIKFRTFNRKTGLASNAIFGVLSDNDAHLWLSSNNGLMRLDPATNTVQVYQSTHGLQGDEFHYGAAYKAPNGTLYFGGANGYNAFDPQELHTGKVAPPLLLTQVLKLNQPLEPGIPLADLAQLKLNYLENAVTFEFAALDFTQPSNNRYRYRLEGFDADWIDAGVKRTATYTNLDPGDYLFRAIGASSDGTWNEQGIAIELNVLPPPWQTPWAYGVYLALLLALVGAIWSNQNAKLRRAAQYRSRLELEVKHRTEELAESNLALQKASEAKSEFVAHMSHEIRSPINGILGMAELLSRTALNTRQQGFAQTIKTSTQSLLEIVNDILDFSKLESSHMKLDTIGTNLEQLVDDVVAMFALQAENKGIELLAQLPAQSLPELMLDPQRLRQVLVNLVSNAIKFTEHGQVLVNIVLVKQTADRMTLQIQVEDSGVGIEPDHQAKIFESFTQAEASTSRKFGGTGLGLSICRELVSLMGGDLAVESEPGRGATFTFTVECAAANELDDSAVQLPANLVLISREPSLLSQVMTYGQGWGGEVEHQPTARAALEQCAADSQAAEQVFLVDPRLPDFTSANLIGGLFDQGVASNRIVFLQPAGIETLAASGDLRAIALPLRRRELRSAIEQALYGQTSEAAQNDKVETSPTLGGNILLVEDNPVNQEVFNGMLAEFGCQAKTAADGGTAVKLAATEAFDLILMDLRLPDFDGTVAAQRIRADGSTVPIIALTANASSEDRARCLDAGMDDFLAKPCPMDVLARTLQKWLPDDLADKIVDTPAEPARQPIPAGATQSDFDATAISRISMLKKPDGSSMLVHAAELFTQLANDGTAELIQAVQGQDFAQLKFTAHKLKSACANLGLVSLAELCRQMEEQAGHEQAQLLGSLVEQFVAIREPADQWLQEQVDVHR